MNRYRPQPNPPNITFPQAKYYQQALILGQFFLPVAAYPAPAPWSVPPSLSPDQISPTDVEAPNIFIRLQASRSPDVKTIPEFLQQTLKSHKSSPTDATTKYVIVNQHQGFLIQRHNPHKAVWNIDSWWSFNTLVGGFHHHYDWLNCFRPLTPVWLVLSF